MSGQYVNDSGMVIRSDPFSEFDRRVVLLTKDHGKITAFAKGARRQNNKLMAATDLFCFGQYRLYPGKEAYTMVDAMPKTYFDELRNDISAAAYGMYFLDVMEYQTRENNDEEKLLVLLYMACRALLKQEIDNRLVKSVFELKTIALQGVFGDKDDDELKKGLSESALYAIDLVVHTDPKQLFTFMLKDGPLNEFVSFVNNKKSKVFNRHFNSEDMIEVLCM